MGKEFADKKNETDKMHFVSPRESINIRHQQQSLERILCTCTLKNERMKKQTISTGQSSNEVSQNLTVHFQLPLKSQLITVTSVEVIVIINVILALLTPLQWSTWSH